MKFNLTSKISLGLILILLTVGITSYLVINELQQLHQVRQQLQLKNEKLISALNHSQQQIKLIFVSSCLLLILLAGIIIIAVKRQVMNPLKTLTNQLRQVNNGDLETKFDFATGNQIDELKDQIVDLTNYSQQLEEKIDKLKERKKEAVDFVQAVDNKLPELVDKIEASLQVELPQQEAACKINQSGQQVVEEIQSVTHLIEDTEEIANLGLEKTNQLNEDLEKMEQVSNDLQEEMDQLVEETQEIEKVIEKIDKIAENTNMLALNASIEAARSGEEGNGFAVVADEIRDLSTEVQQATENIRGLIADFHQQVESAVDYGDQSSQLIKQEIKVVENTISRFQEIGENVLQAAEKAKEVRSGAENQVNSLDNVVQGIEEVNQELEELLNRKD